MNECKSNVFVCVWSIDITESEMVNEVTVNNMGVYVFDHLVVHVNGQKIVLTMMNDQTNMRFPLSIQTLLYMLTEIHIKKQNK